MSRLPSGWNGPFNCCALWSPPHDPSESETFNQWDIRASPAVRWLSVNRSEGMFIRRLRNWSQVSTSCSHLFLNELHPFVYLTSWFCSHLLLFSDAFKCCETPPTHQLLNGSLFNSHNYLLSSSVGNMRVYGSPSGFDWTTTRLTDAELTDSSSFSVWLQSTVKRQLLRSDEASCCVATHSAWMSTNVHTLVSAHPEVQQDKTKQTHTLTSGNDTTTSDLPSVWRQTRWKTQKVLDLKRLSNNATILSSPTDA